MTGLPPGAVEHSELPSWLAVLADAASRLRPEQLSRLPTPEQGGRRGAVLILFGESSAPQGARVPDLLIIERAHDMRSHAGQPAFPGGAIDEDDDGPEAAALREAAEETGVDPSGVEVICTLPDLWLPPSSFVVTPVIAWWRTPCPVDVRAPAEVASVHRVPLDELLDPLNRMTVRHPSGFRGPAFAVRDLLVWGFTGGLLARLLAVSGMERPWDASRVIDLPEAQLRMAMRSQAHPGSVVGSTGAVGVDVDEPIVGEVGKSGGRTA